MAPPAAAYIDFKYRLSWASQEVNRGVGWKDYNAEVKTQKNPTSDLEIIWFQAKHARN